MTFIEKVFLGVLYAMYLYDCVFWLAATETGFTRSGEETWDATARGPLSFTLLGRMPVLAAPLLLRPGFVRSPGTPQPDVSEADAPQPGEAVARALRAVSKRLNRLYLLSTLCRLQAFALLIYLPFLIFVHRLASLWHIFLPLLLCIHLALSTLAIVALRAARPCAWLTPATSLLLNPLGATRAMDLIAQAFFEQTTEAQKLASGRKSRPARSPRKSPAPHTSPALPKLLEADKPRKSRKP